MDGRSRRQRGAGKSLGRDWVDALAVCASVGVDPIAVMRAGPTLRDLLLTVADSGVRRSIERDEALARRIIAALSDALKRGR